jgi:hypothetical protein
VSVLLDSVSESLKVLTLDTLGLESSGRTGPPSGDSDGVLSDGSEHYVDTMKLAIVCSGAEVAAGLSV